MLAENLAPANNTAVNDESTFDEADDSAMWSDDDDSELFEAHPVGCLCCL